MFTNSSQNDYRIDFHKSSDPIATTSLEHREEQYNPYVNNEGSIMAIAGQDYVIVAGDKRLSRGFSIVSRNTSKMCQLTDTAILASSGMYADFANLCKYLKARIEIYRTQCRKEPSLNNIAQLLSIALYHKRFFPYYCFCALCGKDESGKFVCFGYDAVGSYEALPNGAEGSGSKLIVPVLDNVLGKKGNLSEKDAKNLVLETMNGTSCRDIYTGDKLEIMIMRRDGRIIKEEYPLRQD